VKRKKLTFFYSLAKANIDAYHHHLGILLYNCPSVNKTLECIIPFLYHLDPIMVENPLVMLYLVDRTSVEVEWQTPLARFKALVLWFMKGMLKT
jgi:hypothetical protein